MSTAPLDRTVVSADGTPITLTTTGTGPAVILVAGPFDDRSSATLVTMAEELAGSFTVTRYDRRGRGGSGDTAPYAVAREVEDLEAVIAEVGGAVRALAMCAGSGLVLHSLVAGAAVEGAVLYEPSYRPGATPDGEGAQHIAALQQRIDRGKRASAVGYFLVRVLGMPRYAPLLLRLRPRQWRALVAAAPTLPYDARAMDGFALPVDAFATIDAPVLVVAGGDSTDRLKIAAHATVEAIPGSEHTVLQDQNHLVDPAALAAVATRFFQSALRRQ